jgi:hypothetical protein
VRPRSVSGGQAGSERLAGWIAPDGKFYPAAWMHHLQVAEQLRATGLGPTEPWDMRDGWVMVRAHGEVVYLFGLTQAQWDTLGDLLHATASGPFRTNVITSLRQLRDLESRIHS